MSALGHKRTYAAHKLMSALPPIATEKADIGKPSCLLYPQKRTCAVRWLMSALGQKRTFTLVAASPSKPQNRLLNEPQTRSARGKWSAPTCRSKLRQPETLS